MAGLSDTDWESLVAVIDGEPAAEPSPAEPEAPQAQAQTDTEEPAPDASDADVAAEPAVEEPDPRQAELDAREAALAERERAEAQQKAEAAARYAAWQEQQAEKRSNEHYQQLADEYGKEVADQYLEIKRFDVQRRREAEQRADGSERGLTATAIAAEYVLGQERFQQIMELAGHLLTYGDADAMQNALRQERQRIDQDSAEKAAMQKTIMELRAQIEARERPAAADAVDRGAAGPGTGARLQDATDFNDFFELLTQGAA
jgi:hypothetical protein